MYCRSRDLNGSASFSLHSRESINKFLDYLELTNLRISRIVFTGRTEPIVYKDKSKEPVDGPEIMTVHDTLLIFDNGDFLGINMLGAMYNSITIKMNSFNPNCLSEQEKKGINGNGFFPDIIGNPIESVGFDRDGVTYDTFRIGFRDGSSLFLYHPTEDIYYVKFQKTGYAPR